MSDRIVFVTAKQYQNALRTFMQLTAEEIDRLLVSLEDEHLEFKEAKNDYDFEKLVRYCAAIANEGGGKIILGVADKRPRKVVGTKAYSQLERIRAQLLSKIPLRIDACEVAHPNGRVIVFDVPSRPLGKPLKANGVYLMRHGDSLVEMTEDRLRVIFSEIGHDFSAEICPKLGIDGLARDAIAAFRRRWGNKSGNRALFQLPPEQLLRDAEALSDRGVTYAGLILFGTQESIRRHLPQAEVVFEYRSSDASGPAQERKEFRQGFFSFYEDLWTTINLRNDKQHYQDGLFVLDIPTFDERSIREAILNAISHRDYQLGGSVFIRQYPRRLLIESPGGFPVGVNTGNILDRQAPRNRRIADILMKCGLVERSGQGMNVIYERSIEQGKALPDFAGTDSHQVSLTLNGQVQDPNFVRFLEAVGRESIHTFSTQDLIVLDLVHRELQIPVQFQSRLSILVDSGILERFGRGKTSQLILSRRFYAMTGRKGVYTRKRGLDTRTNKELLVRHISDNATDGSRLSELLQVLPGLTRSQVQRLVGELKEEGRIFSRGITKAARWFPKKAN